MFYSPQKGTLINDGKPIYLATTGKKIFRLSEWWQYQDHLNRLFVIPQSFVCDLASVPPVFYWWQYGAGNIGAIAHDWAYIFGYLLIVDNGKLTKLDVTKKQADCLFADINYTLEVPFWINNLMYLAVSLFGKGVWSSSQIPKYGKTLSQLQEEFERL